MTIVIVDGPRGSGKTTLLDGIQNRCEQEGLLVNRFKHERGSDPFKDMAEAIANFKLLPGYVHLCDRFLLTEYVFSTFKNRLSQFNLVKQSREINWLLEDQKAIHIMLMAKVDVIDQRLESRPEGRKWDMPPDLVKPLWLASLAVCPEAVVINNNNEDEQYLAIRHIMYKIHESQKEWEAESNG